MQDVERGRMRIAIVDDEAFWQNEVKSILLNYEAGKNISVDVYSSGEAYIKEKELYDITFVDVEMSGMDGFDTIDKARVYNKDGLYIILTTHMEMSQKGYHVNAFRYLYKNDMEEDIMEALNTAFMLKQRQDKIALKIIGEGEREIELKNITYFETEKGKKSVIIHTRRRKLRCSNSMAEIEMMLKDTWFFRCHNTYIVNFDEIEKIDGRVIILKGGKKIEIAFRKRTECKRKYMDRVFECANA